MVIVTHKLSGMFDCADQQCLLVLCHPSRAFRGQSQSGTYLRRIAQGNRQGYSIVAWVFAFFTVTYALLSVRN